MTGAQQPGVVVIGAGHAGCEAAIATAKLGLETLLITLDPEKVAWMSCNPSIGGLAKGHVAREIDALGGVMGRVIDQAGIQFRVLNTSKGPAVRARRAQADMYRYSAVMAGLLGAQPNLELLVGEATAVNESSGKVRSVSLADGSEIPCRAVVVTTGTFLGGVLHTGLESRPGGRVGEAATNVLSECLAGLGLGLRRLKTGTPPRLDGRTIDRTGLVRQDGDDPPLPFSFSTATLELEQVPCFLTHTTPETHEAIRGGLDRSPLYGGAIRGVGPRYCPSIEDKVVRFPDREQHVVFLEPVARDRTTVYPSGISTSLTRDVQDALVRSIPGLERARIETYGYAVEYDAVDSRMLEPTLEVRGLAGLFLAGQVNGTSGYEEAAGQGLLAGINAAARVKGRPPTILSRARAYIGVMIDDLVTRGAPEPYRLFTSRAEHRLVLREDNADERLTPLGREIGLVDDGDWRRFEGRREAAAGLRSILDHTRVLPLVRRGRLSTLEGIKGDTTLADLLRRPEVRIDDLGAALDGEGHWTREIATRVETEIRYEGYIRRQNLEIERVRSLEEELIPGELDYEELTALSREVREVLSRVRPFSLGQAARISGVTPAAVQILAVELRRRSGPAT